MDSGEKKQIAEKLTEKGAIRGCHRCGHQEFTVLEGYSNLFIQEKLHAEMHIGGPTVPAALVACNNCGAITFHALGALGMLPQDKEGK